jgi:hypothetical protein
MMKLFHDVISKKKAPDKPRLNNVYLYLVTHTTNPCLWQTEMSVYVLLFS